MNDRPRPYTPDQIVDVFRETGIIPADDPDTLKELTIALAELVLQERGAEKLNGQEKGSNP